MSSILEPSLTSNRLHVTVGLKQRLCRCQKLVPSSLVPVPKFDLVDNRGLRCFPLKFNCDKFKKQRYARNNDGKQGLDAERKQDLALVQYE